MDNRIREVYLRLKDYEHAMDLLRSKGMETPVRKYVLAYTLGATGRRISEVLQLTTRDVLFEEKKIVWRILKKRKDYVLVLPASERLLKLLSRYIIFNGVSDRLFPVSRRQAWLDVKRALNEVGLHGWSPHSLRHAFILKALIETKSIELVRRWVAHSKYNMLLEYARIVGLEFDKPLVEL